MKRIFIAVFVAAIAAGALFFETTPAGTPLRAGFGEWLAANALPSEPEKIAAIDFSANLRGLDAALILRAVLRYEPRAVAFLAPIVPGEGDALLTSKLGGIKIPVVFTANANLEPLPGVEISGALPTLPSMTGLVPEGQLFGGARETSATHVLVAARQRQGDRAVSSNIWRLCMALEDASPVEVSGGIPGTIKAGRTHAPVAGDGCAMINPLAAKYVDRIALDQLMLRTERNEQGAISLDLDTMFRGRLVAVEKSGDHRAIGLAALRNHLVQIPPPIALAVAGVLLAATLPWWRGSRLHRALLAVGVSGIWLLLALALYQEFGMVAPLLTMVLLPALALIPPAWVKCIPRSICGGPFPPAFSSQEPANTTFSGSTS